MNPYQKVAAFVIRIVGSILIMAGIMGPLGIAALRLAGQAAPTYPIERWVGSVIWGVGGIILVLASKPIGRRLGGGLE